MPINFRLTAKEIIDVWNDANQNVLYFKSFINIYSILLNKKIINKKSILIDHNSSNLNVLFIVIS